jgi:hypothetical protein
MHAKKADVILAKEQMRQQSKKKVIGFSKR